MVLVQKWPFFHLFVFWAIQARKMCFTIFQNKKRLSKFKKWKNCHFSKGEKKGADGFGPKIAIFSTSFFQAKQGSKMFFSIFWNEKTHLQGIKTKSSKRQKVAIFVKGLTHGFGSKMAIFYFLFFQAIQARNMCFTIFQNEKTPFQAIKKEVQKLEKVPLF